MRKLIYVILAVVGLVVASAILPASANHGPNCDQPFSAIKAFLSDNIDEWNVYDANDDGVACQETHAFTRADIEDSDDADQDESEPSDDVEAPVRINTGR